MGTKLYLSVFLKNLSNKDRCLNFSLSLHLHHFFVCVQAVKALMKLCTYMCSSELRLLVNELQRLRVKALSFHLLASSLWGPGSDTPRILYPFKYFEKYPISMKRNWQISTKFTKIQKALYDHIPRNDFSQKYPILRYYTIHVLLGVNIKNVIMSNQPVFLTNKKQVSTTMKYHNIR